MDALIKFVNNLIAENERNYQNVADEFGVTQEEHERPEQRTTELKEEFSNLFGGLETVKEKLEDYPVIRKMVYVQNDKLQTMWHLMSAYEDLGKDSIPVSVFKSALEKRSSNYDISDEGDE